LQQQVRLASVAATSLGEIPEPEPEPPTDEHADAVLRRGRAGTAVGRAVHAVLQSVDLETGANVESLARAESAAESVPARAAEVAALVRTALNSAPVREAISSGRYWREVFVSAPSNGVLIEGFIDLLYETRDGLVVVDYKTDGVASDDDIVAALARYRLQGAAYVFALEQHLRRPVVACRFLFLRPAGTRTVEIAGLRGAVADVEARVEAIATASL
jgi:ATP-dependent helicase/nuclease subunit A